MEQASKRRNGEIDFLRFAFSILILMHHSKNLVGSGRTPFVGASIMVEFFFLLTGFLMAQSLGSVPKDKERLGWNSFHFMVHKLRGIYPEFLIAWLIAFGVNHIARAKVTVSSLGKDFLMGLWELLLLRMSGISCYVASGSFWYLSAMILSMLILVPLFLRDRERFLYIWAPLIAIAAFGYLGQTLHSLRPPTKWLGFCYSGMLRALGDLCVGCICQAVCERLRTVQWNRLQRLFLTLVEWGCYLAVVVWSYRYAASELDFVAVLFLAVGVTISFSGQDLTARLFDNRVSYFLGRISFPLYLGHAYWSHALHRMYPKAGYGELLPRYFLAAALTTAVICLLSRMLRRARS